MDEKICKRIKIRNILSERIKQIRKSHKMTQDDFAKALGVSKTTITNIECRKTMPNATLLRDISLIFGDEVDFIYKDFEEFIK